MSGGVSDTQARPAGGPLTQEFEIINSRGLHARATAKFVKCVESFNASVTVSREGQTVSGTSIMGLLMLGAHCGSSIRVTASGPQASEALDALRELIESRFGED